MVWGKKYIRIWWIRFFILIGCIVANHFAFSLGKSFHFDVTTGNEDSYAYKSKNIRKSPINVFKLTFHEYNRFSFPDNSPDLQIEVNDSQNPTYVDNSFFYTLNVSNIGTADAINIIITDDLPSGLQFVSASDGGVYSAGTVTWPAISSMSPGANITRTVTVIPTCAAVGLVINSADVSNDIGEITYLNNSDSEKSIKSLTSILSSYARP